MTLYKCDDRSGGVKKIWSGSVGLSTSNSDSSLTLDIDLTKYKLVILKFSRSGAYANINNYQGCMQAILSPKVTSYTHVFGSSSEDFLAAGIVSTEVTTSSCKIRYRNQLAYCYLYEIVGIY